MKKLYLILALAIIQITGAKAQYYEYANAYSLSWNNLYPTYIRGVAVDALGRKIVAGDYQATQFQFESSFISLPSGMKTITSAGNDGNFLNTVTTDGVGNVYVSGYSYSTSVTIGDTTLYNNGAGIFFLIKYNAAGQKVYVKTKSVNLLYLSANNAGTVLYASDGIKTIKINASTGVNLFINSTTGGRLAQDANNNCYVLKANSLTRLNYNNTIAWTNTNAGGTDLYTGNTVNIYVVSGTTVKKLTTSNVALFTYNTGGNRIASNPSGEFYIGTNDGVHKINSTGTAQLWYMGNAIVSHLAIYGWQEIYMAGQFVWHDPFMLCPFKITDYSPAGADNAGYLAKINESPAPFQAYITTHNPLTSYPDDIVLCTDHPYQINYDVCTNASSTFAPNNVFYAELSDAGGSFTNPINIGPSGHAVIPDTIPAGAAYRIRVNSTNPAVIGEAVYPADYSGYFIAPFTAHLSIAGTNSLCVNGSVTIIEDGINGSSYYWYINGVYQDTIDSHQDSIVITAPCNVSCKVDYYGCDKMSNTINISNTLPLAPIIPFGSTTFCAGDSVILATNNCTGCTYKWKKNNINISGATSYQYTATTTGKYKVVVTGSNGCSKTSVNVQVTVNCRIAGDLLQSINDAIELYPNPVYNLLHIECQMARGKTNVEIKNILGQEVYKNEIETNGDYLNTDIKVDQFAQGLYVINVYAGNEIYSARFIKQ